MCRGCAAITGGVLWHGKLVKSFVAVAEHGWCACTTAVQRSRCRNKEAKVREPDDSRRASGCAGLPQQNVGERDRGKNLDSSRQTLNQYLERWLEVCAKPRLRDKSFRDYEGLLRRCERPHLGGKALPTVRLSTSTRSTGAAKPKPLREVDPVHPCCLALRAEAGSAVEPPAHEPSEFR